MKSLLTSLVIAWIGLTPAWAGKNVVQAEHERLSDEIEQLAGRQVWSGVERKYRELERLDIELTEQDYLHGAYAARELGDVLSCYERLRKAAQLHGTKEVVDWLSDIDSHYGQVELISVPARTAELSVDELPFDPNQRNAVQAAVDSARVDGIFVGMLPKGHYVFAGQPFSVEPGVSVRIEVSPRMRRQGIIDPVIVYRERPNTLITSEQGADETSSPSSTDSSDPVTRTSTPSTDE